MESISNIMSYSGAEPWVSISGVLISVFSVILAVYFYRKSRVLKRPFCIISNRNVIDSSINKTSGLEVKYKGIDVSNLSVSSIVFWNAGSNTIRGEDIPQKTPFEITTNNGAVIYNVENRFVKRDSNAIEFTLSKGDSKKVDIKFDFLDRNDGFILDVVHSGASAKALNLEATFIGSEPLMQRDTIPFHDWPKPIAELLSSEFRVVVALVFFFVAPLMILERTVGLTPISPQIDFYSGIISGLIVTCLSWFAAFYLLQTRIPNGFTYSSYGT